jgi:hypothetical protein
LFDNLAIGVQGHSVNDHDRAGPTSFTVHCETPRISSHTPPRGSHVAMVLLIIGEIGGFGVLLAGFVVGQFF